MTSIRLERWVMYEPSHLCLTFLNVFPVGFTLSHRLTMCHWAIFALCRSLAEFHGRFYSILSDLHFITFKNFAYNRSKPHKACLLIKSHRSHLTASWSRHSIAQRYDVPVQRSGMTFWMIFVAENCRRSLKFGILSFAFSFPHLFFQNQLLFHLILLSVALLIFIGCFLIWSAINKLVKISLPSSSFHPEY